MRTFSFGLLVVGLFFNGSLWAGTICTVEAGGEKFSARGFDSNTTYTNVLFQCLSNGQKQCPVQCKSEEAKEGETTRAGGAAVSAAAIPGFGTPGITSCYSQAYYTGEICCQISCYYPKIALCTRSGHPSFCRGASCRCVEQ